MAGYLDPWGQVRQSKVPGTIPPFAVAHSHWDYSMASPWHVHSAWLPSYTLEVLQSGHQAGVSDTVGASQGPSCFREPSASRSISHQHCRACRH